jgi:hypothetical protein
VEFDSYPDAQQNIFGTLPHAVVALYWGRILPLVVRRRQLATWKALLFRSEELATLTEGRPPNRYWVGKWCSIAKHESER